VCLHVYVRGTGEVHTGFWEGSPEGKRPTGRHKRRWEENIKMDLKEITGRDSSFDIATRYGQDGPGDRIPVGMRFSYPVQTGSGAYPASYTIDTGSFPGVKRPGRGAEHPPTSQRRGYEMVELYLYSPSGPQWPVIGRTFTFTLKK
jgi:hypothetical protein